MKGCIWPFSRPVGTRPFLTWGVTFVLLCGVLLVAVLNPNLWAASKSERFWNVDEIRPGMRGYGKTVMHGTKIETFDAEVIGVLKNVSPGRDMVLCRLSGLNLEKTGVIAGMSGSPVYLDTKLL